MSLSRAEWGLIGMILVLFILRELLREPGQ
jgi:hypothetical protein